jgi:hypothetical protein
LFFYLTALEIFSKFRYFPVSDIRSPRPCALPRSLPLVSPFGLPSAGYPASARWHVFRFPVSGLSLPLSFLPFAWIFRHSRAQKPIKTSRLPSNDLRSQDHRE